MKKICMAVAVAAFVLISSTSLWAKPLRVLAIGNSFTGSLNTDMPRIAKDCGCELEYCLLIVGGCSLMHQMELVELAADDASYSPWMALFNFKDGTTYTCKNGHRIPLCDSLVPVMKTARDGTSKPRWDANIHKVLSGEKWDVVVIQQSSQMSWKASSYEPWTEKMIALIRSKAPQAKIMLQQTWSYNELAPRLKSWGMTSQEMYEKLTAAYLATAKKYNLDVIPTGKAFQLYREKKPVKDPWTEDVVGMVIDMQQKPAPDEKFDAVHSSAAGSYLQSCVWVAKLFGANLAKARIPKPLEKRGYSLDLLRNCALEAVAWSKDAVKK